MRAIMSKYLRILSAVLGCFAIVLTVATFLIVKMYGSDIHLDQVLWHVLESPISGIDEHFIKRIVKFSLLAISLCIMWTCIVYLCRFEPILCKLHLNKKIIEYINNKTKYTLLIFCVCILYLLVILMIFNNKFKVYEYIKFEIFPSYFGNGNTDPIETLYSAPKKDEIFFEKKQNIVIILAESLENSFNESRAGEKLILGLERLQHVSQYNNKYINVYGTGWTIASMTGWFFGLPLKVPRGVVDLNEYKSRHGFLPGAESIFEILKENGYQLVFMLGSSKYFSGKDILFSSHGQFDIMDLEYFKKEGWSLDEHSGTGWGYSDAFIFAQALDEYKKLMASGKPFVLFIETVDTHSPDGFCPPGRRKYNDIRDAFLELDRNIAEFAQKIWNDNVILIILGDHFFMGEPDFMLPWGERRIFNLFHGDIPSIPEKKREEYISALDMAPTILQAAGARWGGDQYGLGISLFSEQSSLLEIYGNDKFNEILSTWSPFYSSFYKK